MGHEEEEKVPERMSFKPDYDHYSGFRETLAKQIKINNQADNEVDAD
jgi:hypothetical protein